MAERPREPQGSVSVARGAGAGVGPGPGGCRPRAASRRGWQAMRKAREKRERESRAVRPASGLQRRVGGPSHPPPRRVRAAAAVCALFVAASPARCGARCPGLRVPRSGTRARLEVAFSSSTSVAPAVAAGAVPGASPLVGRGGRVSPGRCGGAPCARAPSGSGGRARSAPPKKLRSGRRSFPGRGRPAGAAGVGRSAPFPAETRGVGPASGGAPGRGYLVDPASSICLSQRLSHACVSAHGRYSETANGSLNQLWFLWSLPSRYLDNCGNSRANTCRRAPTSGDACIYQTKTNPGSPGGFGDSR